MHTHNAHLQTDQYFLTVNVQYMASGGLRTFDSRSLPRDTRLPLQSIPAIRTDGQTIIYACTCTMVTEALCKKFNPHTFVRMYMLNFYKIWTKCVFKLHSKKLCMTPVKTMQYPLKKHLSPLLPDRHSRMGGLETFSTFTHTQPWFHRDIHNARVCAPGQIK